MTMATNGDKDPAEETESGADRGETAVEEALGADPASESSGDEVADLKDRLLRAMAEAENLRKRGERERMEASKFAITRFARDLLSVADNMRRAIDAVPGEARERMDEVMRNLLVGVEMTEKELLSVFERHSVKPLVPRGERFDPNFHQAVAEVPDAQPDGTVVEVFQTGYVLDDRLLRPAMVTVAKGGEKTDPATDKAGETEAGGESAGSPEAGETAKGAKIDTSA